MPAECRYYWINFTEKLYISGLRKLEGWQHNLTRGEDALIEVSFILDKVYLLHLSATIVFSCYWLRFWYIGYWCRKLWTLVRVPSVYSPCHVHAPFLRSKDATEWNEVTGCLVVTGQSKMFWHKWVHSGAPHHATTSLYTLKIYNISRGFQSDSFVCRKHELRQNAAPINRFVYRVDWTRTSAARTVITPNLWMTFWWKALNTQTRMVTFLAKIGTPQLPDQSPRTQFFNPGSRGQRSLFHWTIYFCAWENGRAG